MKLYLSSYKIGEKSDELKQMVGSNTHAIYISNAFDAVTNLEGRKAHEKEDIENLQNLGFDVEHLDLRDYFDSQDSLAEKLQSTGLIWVSGGNVFVLRLAMKLSGFDMYLQSHQDKDFVYGGYSAGCCILSPSLKGLDIVDDATAKPYGENYETVWEGLNIIDFAFAPHYDSDHSESEDIDKEIQYCIDHGIPYKAVRDGEVIIIE